MTILKRTCDFFLHNKIKYINYESPLRIADAGHSKDIFAVCVVLL